MVFFTLQEKSFFPKIGSGAASQKGKRCTVVS